MYIFIYMKVIFPASASHRADKGKDKISPGTSLEMEFPQTAQQQEPGSMEEQTDYVKDGIAKQTLPRDKCQEICNSKQSRRFVAAIY